MNKAEADHLIDTFNTMGVKPKADNVDDLQNWMVDYLKTEGKIPVVGPDQNKETKIEIVPEIPKISIFSGDQKKDVGFELWKHEIKCLLQENTHSRESIMQAVRKSLKGSPGLIAMRLGPNVTIEALLEKLEGIYGDIKRKSSHLAKFFNAKQEPGEDVISWGCRLEELFYKVLETGQIDKADSDKLLCEQFYSNLTKELKDKSSHKFDTVKKFDDLRIELRQIEYDENLKPEPTNPTAQTKAAKAKTLEQDSLNKIHTTVCQMNSKIDGMSDRIEKLEKSKESQSYLGSNNYMGLHSTTYGQQQPESFNSQEQTYSSVYKPLSTSMTVPRQYDGTFPYYGQPSQVFLNQPLGSQMNRTSTCSGSQQNHGSSVPNSQPYSYLNQPRFSQTSNMKCWNCSRLGHRASRCPFPRTQGNFFGSPTWANR